MHQRALMIFTFLSIFFHVYILASLLQPTLTLNITLHFTRQLQDEVALYKSKIRAATKAADNEHLRGNTLIGSFRFIMKDALATIQTAINVTVLGVRVFILLSVLLLPTLGDGLKFYRHVIDTTFRSLTRRSKKGKGTNRHLAPIGNNDKSVGTLVALTAHANNAIEKNEAVNTEEGTLAADGSSDNAEFEGSTDAPRPESDYLPWFKTLFPSTTTTTTSNDHPSLTTVDVASPASTSISSIPSSSSEMQKKKNEWNGTKESDTPNIHTATLFIGNNNDNDSTTSKNVISSSSSSSISISPKSSKSSFSNIEATNKSVFFIKKQRKPKLSGVKNNEPISPPRPLASYSSRPFTTSNALITTTQFPHPLGSSLSLKLKQPGRRISLLFKTKNKK